MVGAGCPPVAVVHARAPAHAGVGLGRRAGPVVVVAGGGAVVVVAGHGGGGVVGGDGLPVAVQRGGVAAHAGRHHPAVHRQPLRGMDRARHKRLLHHHLGVLGRGERGWSHVRDTVWEERFG